MKKPRLKTESLAFALLGAASAVARVRNGTALPEALADVFSAMGAPLQARGAIQDVAYGTLRRLGRTEALLRLLSHKSPSSALLKNLLYCALALISDEENTSDAARYAEFTVVDQAVEAAAAHHETAPAKNMVNAVLRRFLRERASLLSEANADPVAQWNYPRWWIEAMRSAYSEQWETILAAGNRAPPLTLRVNRRRTSTDDYLKCLEEQGMQANRVGEQAIRIEKPVPVFQLPGFGDGMVSVQDAAAQLAAPLLDLHDGMRVLDACAAPGGKTGHLLETAQIDLTALDSDAQRLERIRENLTRLQLAADVRQGDARATSWWDGRPYDRILADVPCTASGIVRRHPDIRWLRRSADTDRLTTLSSQILDNLWQMLRPDGKLLLVTCSLWHEESEKQAAAFAARHQAIRLPAPGQLLPVADRHDDHDGLFYALFQKKP
jgi:16S rRNA (cytosine967-C5)-methyltransferase